MTLEEIQKQNNKRNIKILEAWKAGRTKSAISKEFNLTWITVDRVIRSMNEGSVNTK